ncbi:MAG: hypothetical protein ACRDXE_08945 [Acidimicrobiales bacterium]
MTDHDVTCAATAAECRPDGWIVTYLVEVVFDTDNARTRYDAVGTRACCTSCGEHLDLLGSRAAELVGHARAHEPRTDP